jgi:hypothetical protein
MSNASNLVTLSKSKYISGLQCEKLLWLSLHARQEAQVDPLAEFVMEQGIEIGRLAQELCLGGVLISEEHDKLDAAIASTKRAMEAGAKAVFEAAFSKERALCRVDILKKSRGGWELLYNY